MMMKKGWVFEDQMFLNGWVFKDKMILNGWVFENQMFFKGLDKPQMLLKGSNFSKFSPVALIFSNSYAKKLVIGHKILLYGPIFEKCLLKGWFGS